MRISLAMLVAKAACPDQAVLFKSFLAGRPFCLLTVKNLVLAQKVGLEVSWFIKRFAQDLSGFRKLFLSDPAYAYCYALYVDKCPRDDTRAAACASPYEAYVYALHVDKCPRDDTRKAACGTPYYAYAYALYVDQAPRDDTRAAVCGSPAYAYLYAWHVDCGPRDDTRKAACGTPYYARCYARDLSKAPVASTPS